PRPHRARAALASPPARSSFFAATRSRAPVRRLGQVIEHSIELGLRRLRLFLNARPPRLFVLALLALADEFSPQLAFSIAHRRYILRANMRTIDTDSHGPLPVLDTWRECHNLNVCTRASRGWG